MIVSVMSKVNIDGKISKRLFSISIDDFSEESIKNMVTEEVLPFDYKLKYNIKDESFEVNNSSKSVKYIIEIKKK